ncbi:hypothetical protein HZB08_01930, partial [Candidatus Saganbacteria bacterium]|nr:hypothetical protein [Candidatus Saganbacteria bacterium]
MLKFISDAFLINVSFVLAYYFRFKVLLFITPTSIPVFERYLNILIFVTLIWLAVFKLFGLYEGKKFTALVDEVAKAAGAVTFSGLLLLGLLFLYRELWFSRLVVVNAWWIALILLGASRFLFFEINRFLRFRGAGVRNALILGVGEIGQTLADRMNRDKGLGYRMVGLLPDTVDMEDLKETIQKQKVEEVIIASPALAADKILDIITECERFGVEFKIVPGLLELIASRVDVDEVGGIPLFTISEI